MEEDISILFIRDNVNLVSASRYGTSQEAFENITQTTGSYQKYNQAILLLKKYGIRYIEKSVIMNGNFCDMKSLCRETSYADDRIIVNNSDSYSLKCDLSDEEHEVYYEYYFSQKPKELELYKHRSSAAKCKLWYNSLFVNCRGDIVPCLNLEDERYIFGNIYHDNIIDVWNSREAAEQIENLASLINNSPCVPCQFGQYSHICPANNYYETGNVLMPSVHECRLCKIKARVVEKMLKEGGTEREN